MSVFVALAAGATLAASLTPIAQEGAAPNDGPRLAAQCRYADGTKAVAYWNPQSPIIMAEHHLGKNGGVLFKMDGRSDPAHFFSTSMRADGTAKFDELTNPADIKAAGRIMLYLATRPGTALRQANLAEFTASLGEFTAKRDVPDCPWKTFDVAPGDVNLQDLK